MVYELQMFDYAFECWRRKLSRLEENMVLEVTLVHARILPDFFERPATQRSRDDIVSSDVRFRARRVPASNVLKDRINKTLSHATYTRLHYLDHPSEKPWQGEVFEPLRKRCAEFLHAQGPNDFVRKSADAKTIGVWNHLKGRFRP